jgi:PIN domain nuclease of toxin-antitoxin system
MKYLLDTHTFLWWITDDDSLSNRAREIIRDGRNELFLSAASGWEIAIKAGIGRLDLQGEPEKLIPEQMLLNEIQGLPVQMSHALHVHALPEHHRDPFDRMLVAQCQLEEMPIITSDPQIAEYEIEVVW